MANKILETIENARITAICALLAVTKHFLYICKSQGIKCKVQALLPMSYTSIEECIECDAKILGAVMWQNSVIGQPIRKAAKLLFKDLSVYNLAVLIKVHDEIANLNLVYEDCLICGQVERWWKR